jgi:hypothetical protein
MRLAMSNGCKTLRVVGCVVEIRFLAVFVSPPYVLSVTWSPAEAAMLAVVSGKTAKRRHDYGSNNGVSLR